MKWVSNEREAFSVANGGYANNGIHNPFTDNRDHRISCSIEDPRRNSPPGTRDTHGKDGRSKNKSRAKIPSPKEWIHLSPKG